LNLIYQAEIRSIENKSSLLVLDDIADSFDYKNKYAIIEYINDITNMKDVSGDNLFNVIVLTHNFDFYRTVGSRVAGGDNSYIANVVNGSVQFKTNSYLKNYFSYMKNRCLKNEEIFIVAAIPFVRNLLEYTYSKHDAGYKEYLVLTNLLHVKDTSSDIKISDLQEIYNRYWLNNMGCFSLPATKSVIELINEVAERIANDPILYNSIDIENKIVLSISIRLCAEELMISQIKQHVINGEEIIHRIQSEENQTVKLFNEYKNHKDSFPECFRRELQQVIMMTPENIHINSFMYEPILDMHGDHLQKLHFKLKEIKASL
jgi:hypothetical protein